VFVLTDDYKRLRREWPLSVEFGAFRVYTDLIGQVKEQEAQRKGTGT